MIEIQNLYKQYGETIATDVSQLNITAGEHVGVVGNNGAGKTTLISLMLDLLKADKGVVLFDGENVAQSDDWKSSVAAFIDESFTIDYLTPDEYFAFVGRIRGIEKEELQTRLDKFEQFFNGAILNQKKYIRDLSKGNKKKVGIVGALIANPRVLYLDEPFANLDPSSQIILQRMIANLRDEMTILISSHDLTHISEVCERIIVVENGTIVKDLETSPNTRHELKSYFTAKSDENEI